MSLRKSASECSFTHLTTSYVPPSRRSRPLPFIDKHFHAFIIPLMRAIRPPISINITVLIKSVHISSHFIIQSSAADQNTALYYLSSEYNTYIDIYRVCRECLVEWHNGTSGPHPDLQAVTTLQWSWNWQNCTQQIPWRLCEQLRLCSTESLHY